MIMIIVLQGNIIFYLFDREISACLSICETSGIFFLFQLRVSYWLCKFLCYLLVSVFKKQHDFVK